MSGRPDGDRREPVLPDEDDWFATPDDWFVDPGDPPVVSDEPLWHEDVREPPPRPRPAGLGQRQAVVVLAALAIVAVIAVAIIAVRAIGGSDETTTTTPTVTSPGTTTPAATTPVTTPTTTSTTPASTTPASTTPTVESVPTEATLKAGVSGSSVVALQNALIQLGYDPGPADGSFGSGTTQAVIAFQAAAGLKQDGIAGPETLQAINEALARG